MNQLPRLFFTSLLAVFFASCGDDDPDTSEVDLLVGTWQLESVVRTDCTITSSEGTREAECPTFCWTIVFFADGTFNYTQPDPGHSQEGAVSGRYLISGDQVSTCPGGEDPDRCVFVEFSVTGDKLALISFEEDNGCRVSTNYRRLK